MHSVAHTRDAFVRTLKDLLISELRLEDITAEDITDDTVLFSATEGLRLDSLDAVELVTLLDREFGVRITDPDEARQAFTTFASLVTYLEQHQG